MKKIVIAVLLVCVCHIHVSAQMDKTNQKKLKKVEKLYKKKKYDKAGEKMREVINAYPINENLWGMYEQIMWQRYATDPMANRSLEVSVDGQQDHQTQFLQNQLMYIMQKSKYDYYDAIYYSAMCVPFNSKSSYTLRNIYVDHRYFKLSDCNERSIAIFEKAEEQFKAKNFNDAIALYTKSYQADSSNYKALMYIGDSYFAMKYYGKAAEFFLQAHELQPKLNEPVKYLADAYYERGNYEKAKEYTIKSLITYPEEIMLSQLNSILEREGGKKKLDRNWVLRLSPINSSRHLMTREDFFEKKLHFEHYRNAYSQLSEYYDANGIKKEEAPSDLDQYFEIESWKIMLKATEGEDIPALAYARKMQDLGLLDAYVFISLFNVDMYDQFLDYIANNENEALSYIENFLITDG